MLNLKSIKAREIICPECNLPCLIEFKDYKATFSCCKNNHTIRDVLLSDYKNPVCTESETASDTSVLCDHSADHRHNSADRKTDPVSSDLGVQLQQHLSSVYAVLCPSDICLCSARRQI